MASETPLDLRLIFGRKTHSRGGRHRRQQMQLLSRASRITTLFGLGSIFFCGCSGQDGQARHLQLADNYFKAGQFENAKIEYLNVLARDFDNPRAESQLGIIWFEQGAPLRAYAYLLRARELAPDNLEARTKLAMVLASLGEVAAAREEALAILQQAPAQEEALLVLIDAARSDEHLEEVEEQLRRIPEGNETTYHLGWASVAVRKGDLAYAGSELREALKLEPNSPRVHLIMASVYLLGGDRVKATEEFQTAANLSPARSLAHKRYAEFLQQIGEFDTAASILNEVTREAPDDIAAWCSLAELALTQKKYDEGLSLLQNVLARDPTNLEGLILQAELLVGRGEASKAVAQLENLSTTYPNVPLISYQLGRAYLAQDNTPGAATALNHALAVEPDYLDAILLQAELNLKMGNATLVVPAMSRLLKQQPNLVAAQVLLFEAYRSVGRFDDAAAIIRDQISMSPDSADPYLRLGIILRQQNKDDEARNAFARASELAPNDLSPIEQLIDLDIAQRDFGAARQRVALKLEKDPDLAGTHFLSGKIYAAEKSWDRALAALRRALELDPEFSRAFELLISVYVTVNQLPDAITELQTWLSKHPTDIQALSTLALTYEKMKEYPKARDTYEKLLSIRPNAAAAMNNLAYLYAEQFDQPDKACELANKARALRPNDPLFADTLGWSLYQRGDYQQAFTTLRESAAKLPDNPVAQFHLGLAGYMMGETAAAQQSLRKALAAEADAARKEEVQRRLAFLERATAPEVSIGQLETMTQEQPEDVVVWMRLGSAYQTQKAFEKAAKAYEAALQVNPELLPAAVKLAQLYAGPLQNAGMAFHFAKRARDLAPNDPRAAGVLAQAVHQLGNFSWAYSLFQESARQLKNDPEILQGYAWAAYSLGRVSDARAIMQRVLGAQPDHIQSDDAKTFLTMTGLEGNQRQLTQAEPEIEKILGQNRDYIPALMAQADLKTQRGDTKTAASIYNTVLHKYPDFALAQKRLASLYLQEPARIEEAYSLALKARSALPDDAEAAKILGEISYKRNEFAYAIQLFQESARREPLRGQDLYYLGMSQLRTSQDSEGRHTLEEALSAGLKEPLSGEAQATITELRKREPR